MDCSAAERAAPRSAVRPLRILIGDDQADILEALRLLLKSAGHQAVTADSPSALLRAAQAQPFDLILMDLNYARDTTSGQEGLDLLMRLQAQPATPPIVVMTAWSTVDLAVEAMRRGATDFVQKPWDNTRLLNTIERRSGRRAQSELELARHVQQKLFPQRTVALETIDYAGQCVPARQVSGDYYDFLSVGDAALAFVLADVSGKGMPAALLMASLQAGFRSQSSRALGDARGLLESVNRLFFASSPPEHFATVFFGVYDDRTRRLRYINCGHLPPMLLDRNGALRRLEPTAGVIGLFPEWECDQQEVSIAPGDTLLVFSDGVTEAGVEAGLEYGETRLLAALQSARGEPVARALDRVIESVHAFSPGEQNDDITLIAMRGF